MDLGEFTFIVQKQLHQRWSRCGCAITTAIVSILTGVPVRNTVAMTGEIDLNGSARQIGGLDIKIDKSKNNGVQKVLVPRENAED